ncbi:plasmolipin-like isoform X2 [Oratosquilla oratoria]|uniref:plasmolipin-like isoform X2 n=1 Tax=Oratosquilla oratoria TaxID=337810 RepID=UPI003F772352
MMAETHTTTTKSEISSSTAPTYASPAPKPPGSGVSLCLSYFRTSPGIIKLLELAIGVICMACAAPAWTKGTHWFLFVVVTAFVSTAIWCFIYLLNLKSAVNLPIDWLLTELLNTSITTLLYLIAVIVQFCSVLVSPGRNYAAGFFGIINMLVYAAGSFFLYRDWKDTHPTTSFSSGNVLRRNP